MTQVSASIDAARLAAPPAASQREELAEAARRFEAIFVRQMLVAARKSDFGGDLFQSEGMDTFRQMQDEQFAEIAGKTGAFGLATMIEAQLARFVEPTPPLPPAGGAVRLGSSLPSRNGVGNRPAPDQAHPAATNLTSGSASLASPPASGRGQAPQQEK
ncbi:MAG: rod-binding protein [Sphingomonadaceae bacterium]|jgi:flagellar protein FlgJ